MTDEGTKYQTKIFTGVENRKLPQSVDEWRERARITLTKDAWDYLEGGAGEEDTVHENRSAFKKWRIRPRYLRDVSKRTMEAEFLGQNHESPFILAPIGVQSILHKDGEIASARAAAKMNMPFTLSTVSSITMEEIVKKSPEGEKWLQLYPAKDKNIIRNFIKRAEKAGYSAIVVTADTTMLGWRERDLNNAYLPFLRGEGLANFFSDPVFRRRLEKPPEEDLIKAIMEFISVYVNPFFSREDFKEICSTTEIPVVLKGITHREDVELAFKSGARAVVISNHEKNGFTYTDMNSIMAFIKSSSGGFSSLLRNTGSEKKFARPSPLRNGRYALFRSRSLHPSIVVSAVTTIALYPAFSALLMKFLIMFLSFAG